MKYLTKVMKICNPNRTNNGLKILPAVSMHIRRECKNNPLLVQLLIDNLIILRKNIDASLMKEDNLKGDYALLMSNLIGQRKAYETILDLLTEQEISIEEIR